MTMSFALSFETQYCSSTALPALNALNGKNFIGLGFVLLFVDFVRGSAKVLEQMLEFALWKMEKHILDARCCGLMCVFSSRRPRIVEEICRYGHVVI